MKIRPTRRKSLIYLVALIAVALAAVFGANAVSAGPRHSPSPDAEEHEDVVAQRNSTTGSCGVERWAVKTGTDADVGLINLNSTTPTTIAALDALTAPSSLPAANRVQPTETTVFRLNATLVEYKLEADSDYHLVLNDGSGHTMIAEIPDPACVGSGSPLLSAITSARSAFDATYSPTGSFQTANVPITLTGVGFFDFLHGQTGVAPNGIELHAVLGVTFGSSTGGSVTLANPGAQTGTVGQAASLQLSATDTAGGALTYSATGLPAGLTLDTATGLISGTPTTSGTATVTATATDSTGPSAANSFTWTVNPSVSGGITNGGFETGDFSGWTTTGHATVTSSAAQTGSYGAMLGSTAPSTTSTAAQTFTAPSGSTKLSFSYNVTCPDTVSYDWATATLKDNTTGTTTTVLAKTCVSSSGWVAKTAAVTAGHSYTLTLTNQDDNYAGDPTYTYYDDIALS
ncbi:hypothetical protein ABIA32_000499 [Streptacidiphilus sp. MAP12-20]|uniref:putative Ig domain-containing protein n=1 Tax=Streptacidiphilus sp. MAP12-20 TaxID=3156299 RepID=UPI003513B607